MARTRANARARRGLGRRVLNWTAGLIVGFVVVSLLWVLLYAWVNPPYTFTMLGDRLQGRNVTRRWMPIGEVDRDMVRAVIAAEDSKFCSHRGFDEDAIAAAMKRNARGGNVIRGGSTISQQTAKNAFLWQGGGYVRKGLEAWFTLLIENIWGKRRIMEVYVNLAETGLGTYGANAASERYFGHDASEMSRVEAARIAAVLPLPKKRGAVAPKGFTRRYGNMIATRIPVVAGNGLDGCVYRNAAAPAERPEPVAPKQRKAAPQPVQQQLPGEELEQPQGAGAPPEQAAPEPVRDAEPTNGA